MLTRLTPLILALVAATPAVVLADTRLDLLDTLRLADQFDPNLAAVRANQAAAAQGTTISRSALLPRVVAAGSISDITLKQDMQGITDYRSEQYSIKLTQPLFRWDAWHQHQAAKALRSQSEADAADQTQNLFLAVAEAYLAVLRAQDNLSLAVAQEAALERQREQADARFKVGVVARTDVLEASAQRDNATALRLSAEIALNSARETLNAAVGRDIGELARLQETLPMSAPIPDDANEWTKLARERNPGLIAARLNAQAAKSNRQAQRGGYLPQVDLFASYSDRQNSNVTNANNPSVSFNSGSNEAIGIEAQWELFASGRTLASVKQASLQADAAEAVARAREHQVVNGARTGYLTVKADNSRLQARAQAQASAQLAYDAVQAGYKVGTRNIVDVLLAETNLFAAKRDYANARYDYIVNTLRLYASAGLLDEPLIEQINGWLVK
ncbi:MAG: TolC family outer membrane protein [Moraxellaceae bacterium]|nr:TolC family outer membrane protein [Moraxellaceae bacterium]MDZ4385611.1 TolC family outer membrane protein [Moraxellaceae bacterium]